MQNVASLLPSLGAGIQRWRPGIDPAVLTEATLLPNPIGRIGQLELRLALPEQDELRAVVLNAGELGDVVARRAPVHHPDKAHRQVVSLKEGLHHPEALHRLVAGARLEHGGEGVVPQELIDLLGGRQGLQHLGLFTGLILRHGGSIA